MRGVAEALLRFVGGQVLYTHHRTGFPTRGMIEDVSPLPVGGFTVCTHLWEQATENVWQPANDLDIGQAWCHDDVQPDENEVTLSHKHFGKVRLLSSDHPDLVRLPERVSVMEAYQQAPFATATVHSESRLAENGTWNIHVLWLQREDVGARIPIFDVRKNASGGIERVTIGKDGHWTVEGYAWCSDNAVPFSGSGPDFWNAYAAGRR